MWQLKNQNENSLPNNVLHSTFELSSKGRVRRLYYSSHYLQPLFLSVQKISSQRIIYRPFQFKIPPRNLKIRKKN